MQDPSLGSLYGRGPAVWVDTVGRPHIWKILYFQSAVWEKRCATKSAGNRRKVFYIVGIIWVVELSKSLTTFVVSYAVLHLSNGSSCYLRFVTRCSVTSFVHSCPYMFVKKPLDHWDHQQQLGYPSSNQMSCNLQL